METWALERPGPPKDRKLGLLMGQRKKIALAQKIGKQKKEKGLT